MSRRFPPPWSVEDNGQCFIVKDAAGQKLAYVYFEAEPGRRFGGRVAYQGRGAADCGEGGEAAGVARALTMSFDL
jgi:hypothetical protein